LLIQDDDVPGSAPHLHVGIDGRELQGRPTGTGRYLRSLLRLWLRSTGDEFVVYFDGAAPADRILDHPRVKARVLGDRPMRGWLWQERRLGPAARADGVDVLFCPAYTCPLTARVPRVTTVHDLSFFALPGDFTLRDGFRRRMLVAASIRSSARIMAVSDFTRREIAGRFPDRAERVVCAPEGPDDDLPPPPERAAARRRLDAAGPLLLTVGAIFGRRCVPTLLQATAILSRDWPHLRLDIVGENRAHPPLDLPALVRRLGLERKVRLSGFVSDAELADRYAAADVAVFLSEYEGFGLPALEAMARGVPVVTSTRPALSEIFGPAALTVEPRDPTAVAAAVSGILRSHILRQDLVDRGRALAARYSWEETALRTREALQAAARERR
jgi:glycosyltransferase involved in cell wall biosynthesis